MSTKHNNILHRWYDEVWNQGRAESIDELAAPDVIAHGLVDIHGNDIAGREAFKTFWSQFRGAFPDIHIDIEDGLVDGDKVMVLCTCHGTHTGPGLGLNPTNKPVTFTGTCMARVKEGQLAEVWNSFDFLSLYQQLGVVPASFS
jgi:steroid delta-isomerase-like uncharacterized protein